MRLEVVFLFVIASGLTYGQTDKDKGHVTYTIKFDEMREAKDGYWFDGYLFEVDPMKAPKFNGKKIKISGNFTTVKGTTEWIDKEGKAIKVQGRNGAYKVVSKPKIKIIKD